MNKNNKNLKSDRPKIILSLLGILVLTIIIYINVGSYGILNWDDDRYLIDNPHIKSLSADNISTIFSEFYFGNYHPVTSLSYAIEYSIFGLDAGPYHITNVILHLLNTILVFFLIFLIVKRIDVSSIIALFFAVHPMHVESVAWISERKDMLYTLFYLGALISYLFYLKNPEKLKISFVNIWFVHFLIVIKICCGYITTCSSAFRLLLWKEVRN
jgi:hypothetical protein